MVSDFTPKPQPGLFYFSVRLFFQYVKTVIRRSSDKASHGLRGLFRQ